MWYSAAILILMFRKVFTSYRLYEPRREPAVRLRDLGRLGTSLGQIAVEPISGTMRAAKIGRDLIRQYKRHNRWKHEYLRRRKYQPQDRAELDGDPEWQFQERQSTQNLK